MSTESLASDRLLAAAATVGATLEQDDFERIARAYAEPGRHYHGTAHIIDCLAEFDRAAHLAVRPAEVELALWFHDVVYDPRSAENERRSAEWADDVLTRAGAGSESCRRIREAVLATAGHEAPADADQALLFDVDLSILGRAPDAFDAYDAAIRREYDFVPDEAYRRGRAEVLRRLLTRDPLYFTDTFRARYDEAARTNLRRALARLETTR